MSGTTKDELQQAARDAGLLRWLAGKPRPDSERWTARAQSADGQQEAACPFGHETQADAEACGRVMAADLNAGRATLGPPSPQPAPHQPATAEPWQAGGPLAALFTAADDDEYPAIEAAAVRAGLLFKCTDPDCHGAGIGCPGDLCQSCGAVIGQPDDCAICVPGQCPGPDCPGNYGSEEENPAAENKRSAARLAQHPGSPHPSIARYHELLGGRP